MTFSTSLVAVWYERLATGVSMHHRCAAKFSERVLG